MHYVVYLSHQFKHTIFSQSLFYSKMCSARTRIFYPLENSSRGIEREISREIVDVQCVRIVPARVFIPDYLERLHLTTDKMRSDFEFDLVYHKNDRILLKRKTIQRKKEWYSIYFSSLKTVYSYLSKVIIELNSIKNVYSVKR